MQYIFVHQWNMSYGTLFAAFYVSDPRSELLAITYLMPHCAAHYSNSSLLLIHHGPYQNCISPRLATDLCATGYAKLVLLELLGFAFD
jgi:hypothetical protein